MKMQYVRRSRKREPWVRRQVEIDIVCCRGTCSLTAQRARDGRVLVAA